ncbi:MAG TPA: DUF3105 domain-containing protein [Polyangiaceae bacterium]
MPDRTALAAIALLPLAAVFASCRGGSPEEGSPYADAGPLDAPDFVDAGCTVEIDTPPLEAPTHVPIGTDITWDSNPPSSGEHFPIWAAYQAYTSPVPRGYYVHDEEHGGVILLYDCPDDSGCPDVAAALQAVSDSLPDDPLCTSAGQGVRVRTVITPDPLLDVPVAAAAWGWVYRAQCVDLPSLEAFASQHYGNGPEVLCANGTTEF